MKKLRLNFFVILVLLFTFSSAAGATIPAAPQAIENGKAPDHSPVIDKTEDGWNLTRVDLIHYAKSANQGKAPKTETCYKLMGVKWGSLPVSYVINPTNGDGLDEAFVTSAISASAETWDAATLRELMNNYTIDNSAQYGVQNYQNAIVFGSFSDNRIIGVTTVWYTPLGRQIVEFDIKLNDYYQWGDATTADSSKMDLQNIATHELGHAVGLNDIYSTTCGEVTMYGYSIEGETIKRDLEPADVTGLQKMYGV